jgi:hypothetical protein
LCNIIFLYYLIWLLVTVIVHSLSGKLWNFCQSVSIIGQAAISNSLMKQKSYETWRTTQHVCQVFKRFAECSFKRFIKNNLCNIIFLYYLIWLLVTVIVHSLSA